MPTIDGGSQPSVSVGSGTNASPIAVPGYSSLYKPAGAVKRWQYSVTTLKATQVAQILYQVGFRGTALQTFVGVAMRESAGGGTWIVGDPTGGASHEYSFGIFGLNTLGTMWDEMRRMVPGLIDRRQLLNPVINAMVAFAMYKRYGERPWASLNGTWNPAGRAANGTDQAAAAAAVSQASAGRLLGQPFQNTNWTFGYQVSGNTIYASGMDPAGPAAGVGAGSGVPTPAQPGMDPAGAAIGAAMDPRTAAAVDSSTIDYNSDNRFAGYGGAPGPSGPISPLPANASPADVEAFIRDNYGYMSAYLNHPEIGPILREAATNGWSRDRLYGRLSQTNWWKTTNDAQRKADAIQAEDPATATRMQLEMAAKVADMAGQMGLQLTDDESAAIGWFAVRNGLNDAQLKDHLTAHMKINWAGRSIGSAGQAGDAQRQMRKMAADYFVKMSPEELDQLALAWVSDESNAADIKARMAARAKSKFANNPDIISLLDRGFTPADAFAGHTAEIARILEVSPDSINLASPEWEAVLQRPTPGGIGSMTVTEAGNYARKTDAFVGTTNARKATTNALTTIRRAFGF